jgi:hypothetical protein
MGESGEIECTLESTGLPLGLFPDSPVASKRRTLAPAIRGAFAYLRAWGNF